MEKMSTSQIRPKNVILPLSNMMYPFMTLDDNAEIVHSEMGKDGRVKVYIEKPDAKDGFHRATCYLPTYTWEDIFGFSDEEIDRYKKVIESTAHLIMEFSQKGGFSNAAQKVENGMDALWVSDKWNNEKNEEILKEHLRTPYKGKVP